MTTDYSAITDQQLRDAFHSIVDAAPDTVYAVPEHMSNGASCYYVHNPATSDGEPIAGCLIGQTLVKLGVPLEVLADREHQPSDMVMFGLHIGSPRLQIEFRQAQMTQDIGKPWKAAATSVARKDAA